MAAGCTRTMLPFVSLLVALIISTLLSACQPVDAHRSLGRLRPSKADSHGSVSESSELIVQACGYFDVDDPRDRGLAHQSCYSGDGTVEFCCLSGSSKCSCPVFFASEFGCYNYESANTKNAVTGEECGYFLPTQELATVRRELAKCAGNVTCPPAESSVSPCTDSPLAMARTTTGGNLACLYADGDECDYNKNTGVQLGSSTSPCCPSSACFS